MTAAATTAENWYLGEEPKVECDFLMPDGDCCDQPGRYAIWWTPDPKRDCGTEPVSSGCLEHALTVDRSQVDRINSFSVGEVASGD